MALTQVTYAMISGALVNVQDYGADPTGATDSTAAFTTAAALGKPLWMPQGDYVISGPVTITSGLFDLDESYQPRRNFNLYNQFLNTFYVTEISTLVYRFRTSKRSGGTYAEIYDARLS